MAPFRPLSPRPADVSDSFQSGHLFDYWRLVIALPLFVMIATILRRTSFSKLLLRLRSFRYQQPSQRRGRTVKSSSHSAVKSSNRTVSQAPGLRRQMANPRTVILPTKVEARDIDLQVSTLDGRQVSLNLDILSPGEIIRRRVTLALGMEPSGLQLPSGKDLDLAKSLNTQGLKSGDVLSATFPTGVTPVPKAATSEERKLVEIKRFGYYLYTSEVSAQQDSFEVSISSSQEPSAMKEAEDSNVRVEFSETSFSISIRGQKEDFVLRRRIGEQGAIKGDILPVGFAELCPPRCSYTLVPRQKLTLVLRPYPENWLRAGTRVKLLGLREASDLNECCGTITDFYEGGGKFLPTRYGVKLDNGLLRKIKRENIHQLSAENSLKPSSGCTTSPLANPSPLENVASEIKPVEQVPHQCAETSDPRSLEPDRATSKPDARLERVGTSAPIAANDVTSEKEGTEDPVAALGTGGDVAGGVYQHAHPESAKTKHGAGALEWSRRKRNEIDEGRLQLIGVGEQAEGEWVKPDGEPFTMAAGDVAGGHQAVSHGTDSITKKSDAALAWSRRRRKAGDEQNRLDLLA